MMLQALIAYAERDGLGDADFDDADVRWQIPLDGSGRLTGPAIPLFDDPAAKNIELETLKASIRAQLEKLIRLNKTRADYLTKFEELIDSYNAGSRNIEELFNDLRALTRALTDEQQRHVRENLSEEELTVFDLLTRPGPELSAEERDEVRKWRSC